MCRLLLTALWPLLLWQRLLFRWATPQEQRSSAAGGCRLKSIAATPRPKPREFTARPKQPGYAMLRLIVPPQRHE